MMTGLHGIHILVGIVLLAWIAVRANRGEFQQRLLHARRPGRPVLAPGRFDLDLSVPAVLSDQMSTHTDTRTRSRRHEAAVYLYDAGRAADSDRHHGGRVLYRFRIAATS